MYDFRDRADLEREQRSLLSSRRVIVGPLKEEEDGRLVIADADRERLTRTLAQIDGALDEIARRMREAGSFSLTDNRSRS